MGDITFTLGKDRLNITITITEVGSDIFVMMNGGNRHIGAIAMAFPDNRGRPEVLSLVAKGHRDDIPARLMAEEIVAGTGKRTAVMCGIHFDDITSDEIESVMSLVNDASRLAVSAFMGRDTNAES
jgi:hypothetical protein